MTAVVSMKAKQTQYNEVVRSDKQSIRTTVLPVAFSIFNDKRDFITCVKMGNTKRLNCE